MKRAPAVLACGAGFLAMAVLIHAWDWWPNLGLYTLKVDHYRESGSEYSILFVGASRVYRHIVPEIFDRTLAERGIETHSFNMGVDALSLIELKTLADEILEHRDERLTLLFVEPSFATNLPLRNLATRRSVFFHDLDNTRLEIRINLATPRYRWDIDRNALAGLYHYANIGRFASWFFPPLTIEDADDWKLARPARGYLAQDANPSEGTLYWHEQYTNNIEAFAAEMREPKQFPEVVGGPFIPRIRENFRIAEKIQAAGIRTVFLITPVYHHMDNYLQFQALHDQEGTTIPLLSYINDFPEIYQPEYWFDPGHLTGTGAELFTRRLAEDVARMYFGSPSGTGTE